MRFITPASISARKVIVDEMPVDEVRRRNVRRRVVVIPSAAAHSRLGHINRTD